VSTRRRYLFLATLALGLVAAAFIAVAIAGGRESGVGFDSAHSDYTPSSIQGFNQFSVYWLGEQYNGSNVRAINHRDGQDPRSLAPSLPDYVSVKYGECNTSNTDTGCFPPLEVQIWPACGRNRAMYQMGPESPYPREDLTLRGVPAAFFDMDSRLELYTGDVTVVLFGSQRQQLLSAATGLQAVDGTVAVGDPLPEPVAGALEGELDCS
jgi:hypothetical protein